jgi:hypothetical protein
MMKGARADHHGVVLNISSDEAKHPPGFISQQIDQFIRTLEVTYF